MSFEFILMLVFAAVAAFAVSWAVRLRGQYVSGISGAKRLIDEAAEEKAVHFYARKALRPEYTVIMPQNEGDPEYLRQLAVILESPSFLFFMFKQRQDVLQKLIDSEPDRASELQGILKGVDLVMKCLGDAKEAHLASLAASND